MFLNPNTVRQENSDNTQNINAGKVLAIVDTALTQLQAEDLYTNRNKIDA